MPALTSERSRRRTAIRRFTTLSRALELRNSDESEYCPMSTMTGLLEIVTTADRVLTIGYRRRRRFEPTITARLGVTSTSSTGRA